MSWGVIKLCHSVSLFGCLRVAPVLRGIDSRRGVKLSIMTLGCRLPVAVLLSSVTPAACYYSRSLHNRKVARGPDGFVGLCLSNMAYL